MADAAAYVLERALLPDGVHDHVLVVVEGGRFIAVEPGVTAPGAATRLAGLAVPGFANTHSHAFHRALRGRTQRGRGTFWTWREQMYDVASRLTPDDYHALARATFREMVAAGMSSVGEFHYLHHQPDGTRYADHAMERAVVAAAREAGIRIALLDTCYLAGGFGEAPTGAQLRYSDGDAQAWATRSAEVRQLLEGDGVVVGAAIHSVRAVPVDQLATVVAGAAGRPLHLHLSEQRAENDVCLAATGLTPTALLARHGALGPTTTAVHATHLTDDDIALLGGSGTHVSFCPTTERDLGDGIGPSRRLHGAGSTITLGSDSHAVIDHGEEMRALEMDERLATERRGHWSATELLDAATHHAGLGFADAGAIAVGRRADLTVIDTAGPRTAGTGADAHTAAFAATAADVDLTMVDGRVVFTAADRAQVGRELDDVIGRLWP